MTALIAPITVEKLSSSAPNAGGSLLSGRFKLGLGSSFQLGFGRNQTVFPNIGNEPLHFSNLAALGFNDFIG